MTACISVGPESIFGTVIYNHNYLSLKLSIFFIPHSAQITSNNLSYSSWIWFVIMKPSNCFLFIVLLCLCSCMQLWKHILYYKGDLIRYCIKIINRKQPTIIVKVQCHPWYTVTDNYTYSVAHNDVSISTLFMPWTVLPSKLLSMYLQISTP